jgi:hypothetical protein
LALFGWVFLSEPDAGKRRSVDTRQNLSLILSQPHGTQVLPAAVNTMAGATID